MSERRGGSPEQPRTMTGTAQRGYAQLGALPIQASCQPDSRPSSPASGINRMIKLAARAAHGFRNPTNQRLRTRCVTTRRARGHLHPAY